MENKTQPGLGEYLRSEREKRHITIEQVASATKINIKLLHALESDNYDALPAKPFVRGFVTSYTRYIGLDYKEILTRFEPYLEEKSGAKFKRPEDSPHLFVEKDPQVDNSKTALSIVMIAFIVLGVLLFAVVKPSLKHHRGKEKSKVTNEEIVTVVPPPSDTSPKMAPSSEKGPAAKTAPAPTPTPAAPAKVVPVPAAKATPTPAPKPTPTPAPKAKPTPTLAPGAAPKTKPTPTPAPKPTPSPAAKAPTAEATPSTPTKYNQQALNIPYNQVKVRLTVRAVDDTWVRYQSDDRPVFGFILKKGKTIFVRGRESIRFTTGNPKGIEISYDNVQFSPYPKNAKVLVLPKELEAKFANEPFVPVNPIYLSTPTR